MLKTYGHLDEKMIQIYTRQLLEALQYLHKNKIYHKNLKPNNIYLETDGTVKICDYIIDNLILGNEIDFYNYLLNSEKIEYYLPPFFIQSIRQYNDLIKKNKRNIDNNGGDVVIFYNWQSFDLYFVGWLIIELFSGKKIWNNYNFKNNEEFFDSLGVIKLVIPIKLSNQCKELIKILFDYSLTKRPDIYDIIFNLDFFKIDTKEFKYYRQISLNSSINDSSLEKSIKKEDSNSIGNFNKENGKQLGKIFKLIL